MLQIVTVSVIERQGLPYQVNNMAADNVASQGVCALVGMILSKLPGVHVKYTFAGSR